MQSEKKALLLNKNVEELNNIEHELLQLARVHRGYEIHFCADTKIVKIYGPKYQYYDS